jgi:hypothetical protein
MNAQLAIQTTEYRLPLRLLGENWDTYAGSSRFSVFWRASRLNHLSRSELHNALGTTLRSNENPFEKITHTHNAPNKLLALSPRGSIDPTLWPLQYWWPYGGEIPWNFMPWRLRACPACARSCYHSMLFQAPGVHCCPWHGMTLVEVCPRCDRPLLSGFRHGLPLGLCPCGHDLVDYISTVEGDISTYAQKQEVIAGYAIWAAASRRVNYLVSPQQWDPLANLAFHALTVPPPAALLPAQHVPLDLSSQNVLSEDIRVERSIRYDQCRLSPRSGLESVRPSIVSLPSTWQDSLNHVGEELLRTLPTIAIRRLADNQEARAATRHLSVYPGLNGVYLHTDCIHPATLRSLCIMASAMCPENSKCAQDSLASRVKAHSFGDVLLNRTIQRVLVQGYADGAQVALGRYAPELYANNRKRPKTRFPWTVICLPPGRMPSAKIAWTMQSGTF